MHVSDDDSNKFCKFDEIWWTLKKCWNFMIFWRAGSVCIFVWKKLTSLNRLIFHMHVSDDDSNMFCKFEESWWLLKKCWNFMIFQRAGTVSIFPWNKLTSLNGLTFHMHVSDDDSKKIWKVWWKLVNFEKIMKFYDISRTGTVGIFLWNKLTSLYGLKFNMHVSYDDSNMFCKFDEMWWTLKKKMLKFHDILKGRQCKHFSMKNWTSLNWLEFHMHVSDDDSNMFCKFDEIWWTLKKCWSLIIFLGPALSAFFFEKI